MSARFLRSLDVNPYRNLAREEASLLSIGEESQEPLLFVWQNAKTVVIGRNQNPWFECDTKAIEEDKVLLARRTTGGGAVYHDLGNVNFSFLLPRGQYDLNRQLGVILRAVKSFGIDCTFSGRNDLVAGDRKFSGNAFRFTKHGALHHGTLMIGVKPEMLSRYLRASKEKLAARGVQSVVSRVINLNTLADVTVDSMISALFESFREAYKCSAEELIDDAKLPDFAALSQRNEMWSWNYGATPSFDAMFTNRFHWGSVQLLLSLMEGCIAKCTVFTDAMDIDLAKNLEEALIGCAFQGDAMAERVSGDLQGWIRTLEI